MLRELPISLTPSQLIYIIPGNRPAIASTQAANALSASIWLQYFLAFQAETENFYREYLKVQKEAEEYENALYERVQDYVCKMKKEELRQALLELLFDSPEWQFD